MDDFFALTGRTLAEMRLVIEGAVSLYESDLSSLYIRAIKEGYAAEASSLDSIEAALRSIRESVCGLQAAYMKERLTK